MSKTVAIVGASAERRKYGNKSVRAHAQAGWVVYPINPRGGQIEGLRAYASLDELPRPVDRVSLYVPPDVSVGMVDAIAALGAREVFVNPGAESDELLAALRGAGVEPRLACSILDLGLEPSQFPE